MCTGKDSSEATDDLDDMPLAERRSLIRLRKAASPLSRVPEPPKCFHFGFSAYASFYYFLGRVIEDMSIQVNVPALAMEEVAPLAVSDAAMLAPEEIFHGKGNIKEEAELTKEERKRRRANQKRRFRRLKDLIRCLDENVKGDEEASQANLEGKVTLSVPSLANSHTSIINFLISIVALPL
ncbi:hypothetical protein ZIOFF_056861 [Zingiber officinale]|uniref:Uncharacterized protein n=1 Tax=Zingiber officinale TaxID=94328 RepID=A0A8J5KL94_ZINOF|nr:hypothetical protein ZIOFF_056861 [Zingiber officinale]